MLKLSVKELDLPFIMEFESSCSGDKVTFDFVSKKDLIGN